MVPHMKTGTHACMHACNHRGVVLQTCSGVCTRPPGGGKASIFSIAARRCSAFAPLNPARSMKLEAITPAARSSSGPLSSHQQHLSLEGCLLAPTACTQAVACSLVYSCLGM